MKEKAKSRLTAVLPGHNYSGMYTGHERLTFWDVHSELYCFVFAAVQGALRWEFNAIEGGKGEV
jgi:hypothetical protein